MDKLLFIIKFCPRSDSKNPINSLFLLLGNKNSIDWLKFLFSPPQKKSCWCGTAPYQKHLLFLQNYIHPLFVQGQHPLALFY